MTVTHPLVRPISGAPWTIDDLAGLPDDGYRHEILDGSLLMSPPPDTFHGRVVTTLTKLLDRAAPRDVIVSSAGFGVDVRNASTYYLPDVIVFRRSALDQPADAIQPAEVLLVVEVLAPGNARRDLVMKRHDYAEAGIPQYWIVDPQEQAVTVLRLDGSGRCYEETIVVKPGDRLRTDDPLPIDLDPGDFLPPPQFHQRGVSGSSSASRRGPAGP